MAYRVIFFDTETTGLNPERDRIVELAAYDPSRDATFQTFIKPSIPIPKEATAISGITNEMVADAPSFSAAGKDFIAFCDGDVVLIAHNGESFDVPFMRREFGRNNLSMPSTWVHLDSLKWARRYRRDIPKHSLQYLRQIYNVTPRQAHRALTDVMVLADVWTHMVDDLTIEQVMACLKITPQAAVPQAPVDNALLLFR